MKNTRRLLAAFAMSSVAAGAYFVGARTRPAEASPPAPPVLIAAPLDVTIANPTAVLLGEAKVPGELLRGSATPAPNLVVPDLAGK